MSDLVLDASLSLQWFLEDESGREYGLAILRDLSGKRAAVPSIWSYEVSNGLVMACRRKRISGEQLVGFLTRLRALPIDTIFYEPTEILALAAIALERGLTTYDAAYLDLAMRLRLPLATTDRALRSAAAIAGVSVITN